ncbi:MAG: hypothetical protein OXT67_12610 [Zetaproteobacteria bacterium]|nr:hypothetical protein [Zetaproteobacteria bacterium]
MKMSWVNMSAMWIVWVMALSSAVVERLQAAVEADVTATTAASFVVLEDDQEADGKEAEVHSLRSQQDFSGDVNISRCELYQQVVEYLSSFSVENRFYTFSAVHDHALKLVSVPDAARRFVEYKQLVEYLRQSRINGTSFTFTGVHDHATKIVYGGLIQEPQVVIKEVVREVPTSVKKKRKWWMCFTG